MRTHRYTHAYAQQAYEDKGARMRIGAHKHAQNTVHTCIFTMRMRMRTRRESACVSTLVGQWLHARKHLCIYAYMHTCMRIRIGIHPCIRIRIQHCIRVHRCMRIGIHPCIRIQHCICIRICIRIRIRIRIRIQRCIRLRIRPRILIPTHAYAYTRTAHRHTHSLNRALHECIFIACMCR